MMRACVSATPQAGHGTTQRMVRVDMGPRPIASRQRAAVQARVQANGDASVRVIILNLSRPDRVLGEFPVRIPSVVTTALGAQVLPHQRIDCFRGIRKITRDAKREVCAGADETFAATLDPDRPLAMSAEA